MLKLKDMRILEGKKVSDELFSKLPKMNGEELSIITVGDDPASKIYVNSKKKACERVGLVGVNYKFSIDAKWEEVDQLITKLNNDKNVVGIIVQQPLPKSLTGIENKVIPSKDVDGLTHYNLFRTFEEDYKNLPPSYFPATPQGIMFLLDYYNIPIEGKNVVVIGRSNIVGKPISSMLDYRNATVTVCHSKTRNLKEITRKADILIVAIGKPEFIDSSYIKRTYIESEKPVIVDVGINRVTDNTKPRGYKVVGDVNFNEVKYWVGDITTVPGGVGLMTIYSLMYNCCKNV